MRLAIIIIVLALVATFGLAYLGKGTAVAGINEGCVGAGGTPELCSCVADKFSDEVGMMSFVGIGGFRPLLPSDEEMSQIGATAGAACAAEITQ